MNNQDILEIGTQEISTKANPSYTEVVKGLHESNKVITLYERENCDLKNHLQVEKMIRSKIEEDYRTLENKMLSVERNTTEHNKVLYDLIKNIGKGTDDSYKQKSKEDYDKLYREEIDKWNKSKKY